MHVVAHRPADVVSALPALACTCGRLRRATRALTQLYDDLMAPSGLRVTQFSLLRTLATHGTARMSDLARALLLDRTALSRTLDPLVERGSRRHRTGPRREDARSIADDRPAPRRSAAQLRTGSVRKRRSSRESARPGSMR
jgi:hypothetical protein